MEVSQRINKLIDENEDNATVPDWEEIVKLLRPFGGRTANEYRQRLGMPDHTPQQSSKEEYNKKWKYRENLRNVGYKKPSHLRQGHPARHGLHRAESNDR